LYNDYFKAERAPELAVPDLSQAAFEPNVFGLSELRQSLSRLNGAAAGDISDIDPQSLKHLVQLSDDKLANHRFTSSFLRYANLRHGGGLPPSWKGWIEAGEVTPLARPDGKMRTAIALWVINRVGDNMAAVFLVKKYGHELQRMCQFGAGAPSGQAAIIASVQKLVRMLVGRMEDGGDFCDEDFVSAVRKTHVGLFDDLKNFFNLIQQPYILKTVLERIPEFARYAQYSFGNGGFSRVFYGNFVPFLKTVGVPMGGALSAILSTFTFGHMLIEPWLKAIANNMPMFQADMSDAGSLPDDTGRRHAIPDVLLNENFIDDGGRVISWRAALAYFEVMFERGPQMGIILSLPKTFVVVSDVFDIEAFIGEFMKLKCRPQEWTAEAVRKIFTVVSQTEGAVRILGSIATGVPDSRAEDEPVSPQDFFVREKCERVIVRLRKIRACDFVPNHVKVHLIKICSANAQLNNLLAGVNIVSPFQRRMIDSVDRYVNQFLLECLPSARVDDSKEIFDELAVLQFRSKGVGLGLLPGSMLAPIAFCAGGHRSRQMQPYMLSYVFPKASRADYVVALSSSCISSLRSVVPEALDQRYAALLVESFEDAFSVQRVTMLMDNEVGTIAHLQSRLTRMAFKVLNAQVELAIRGASEVIPDHLLDGLERGEWCAKRLLTMMDLAVVAGVAVLRSPFAVGFRKVSDTTFGFIVAHAFGIPLEDRACPACATALGHDGSHAASCRASKPKLGVFESARKKRHDKFAQLIVSTLRKAGIPVEYEQMAIGSQKRPGDIVTSADLIFGPGCPVGQVAQCDLSVSGITAHNLSMITSACPEAFASPSWFVTGRPEGVNTGSWWKDVFEGADYAKRVKYGVSRSKRGKLKPCILRPNEVFVVLNLSSSCIMSETLIALTDEYGRRVALADGTKVQAREAARMRGELVFFMQQFLAEQHEARLNAALLASPVERAFEGVEEEEEEERSSTIERAFEDDWGEDGRSSF
jgi:hypothetical protein